MRRLAADPIAPAEDVVEEAARVLRAGGIVAYPTDTLYGLAADPASPHAVARLFDVKGRGADAPVPLAAADLAQARAAVRFTPLARRLAERFWPGPLTLVLPSAMPCAPGVAARDGSLAIRVPDHPIARALAAALGRPITATSANRSGEPPAAAGDEVVAALGASIDLLVDAGPAPGGPPSTIVDASGGAPRLLRAGAIAWDRVLESLQ